MIVAHPGQPIAPHDLWSAWNSNITLLLTLALTLIVYLWGIHKVWRQAGIDRGVTVRHSLMFIGAMAALVLALVSPLDALSSAMFSAHMVQHFILMLIAAPLLFLSDFSLIVLWALPRHYAHLLAKQWNRDNALHRVWRFISHPFAVWFSFGLTCGYGIFLYCTSQPLEMKRSMR